MDHILHTRRHWPLHGTQASRALEQRAQASLPPHTLMQRAGQSLAALTRALYPHAQRVWIACGPGNNGGDGFDAAIHLAAAGLVVELAFPGDAARLPPDAADALRRARAVAHAAADTVGLHITHDTSPQVPPDVALDAVLGLGLNRPAEGPWAALIEALNELPCPVIAADLPSGLDADSGEAHAPCVQADHTLALLSLKPGLFTGAGRDQAGDIWLSSLDVAPHDADASAWLANAPILTDTRRHIQHKGSFGDVLVVAGAPGMGGAALLAARSAHAAGAGRVLVDPLDVQHAAHIDALRPELMVRVGWSQAASSHELAATTVVAGCGGGEAIRHALPRLMTAADRLVLDADGLNAVAAMPALAGMLAARNPRGRETVLTPHPLEAARLLGVDTATVQADRIGAAQNLAERFGAVVVLKGSGTVIATPDGAATINATGNAALATAGTGDVLAGWIAGVWAAHGTHAVAAARHAVWWHGWAADHSLTSPLRAGDLIEAMHRGPTPSALSAPHTPRRGAPGASA